MKLLMVTNKVRTYALGFQNMFEPLLKLGHSIVWAADFSGFIGDNMDMIPATIEQISISSNPLNKSNKEAYKQILAIIDKYNIEGMLCSTPIGGALARLAAKKKDLKPVLYAAHGFLFFKGAPLLNRTIYKWEEVILAHYTDALITITEEDYSAAQKLKLRSRRKPYFVHGAGVNIGVKVDVNKAEKRKSLGVPEDCFLIISAGDINKNKNNEVVVKSLIYLGDMNVHYIACGVGEKTEELKILARDLGVEERFHLLGYRTDVLELMKISDAFVMMSFREGIPRSLLEAMDLGLPCVGSDTRGIRDLIDKEGGFICKPNDSKAFAKAFRRLYEAPELKKHMGIHNQGKVNCYSKEVVKNELYKVYEETFGRSNECE